MAINNVTKSRKRFLFARFCVTIETDKELPNSIKLCPKFGIWEQEICYEFSLVQDRHHEKELSWRRHEGKVFAFGPSLQDKLLDVECPQSLNKGMVFQTIVADHIGVVYGFPCKKKSNAKVFVLVPL